MIYVCVVSFNITTGAGPVDVAISDPLYGSFTPVCAMFIQSGRTESTSSGSRTTSLFGQGFATDGVNRAWSIRDQDAAGTSIVDRGSRDEAIVEQGNGAQVGWAKVASGGFTNGNMRLTIGDAFTTDLRVVALVLGGDIQAEVGTFVGAGTAPVNQTINNTGNFQPDVTLIGSGNNTAANPATLVAARHSFGGAQSTSRQWAGVAVAQDAATSGDTARYNDDSLCFVQTNATPAVVDSAEFVSHNASPGGITINWTARVNAPQIHYLMMRSTSPNSRLLFGTKTTRTDTVDDIVSGFGFCPRALLVASVFRADASAVTGAEFGVGVATGPTAAAQIGQTYSSRDGNTAMFVGSWIDYSRALINLDSTVPSVEGLYKVKSWQGDGVTFSGEDDTMPSADVLMYFAVGEVLPPARIVQVNQARHRASYY